MRADYHPLFHVDLKETADHLAERDPGLAAELVSEVEANALRAAKMPLAYRRGTQRMRRCLILRFRLELVFEYEAGDDAVRFIALAHTSREPGYWQARLE